MTVLGAVTDDGDSFYCWTEENLTSQQGIWLLEALQEVGEELVVFLDRAGYFYNRDLWEHVIRNVVILCHRTGREWSFKERTDDVSHAVPKIVTTFRISGERATETVGDSSVACVCGDEEGKEHHDVWYFPPKLPELNPVEGCWDRLNEWFKHRLIPDLSTLKQQIQRGLPTVDESNIWNYLCP